MAAKQKRSLAEHEQRREEHNRRTAHYHARMRSMPVAARHAQLIEKTTERIVTLLAEMKSWQAPPPEVTAEHTAMVEAVERIDAGCDFLRKLAETDYDPIPRQRRRRIPIKPNGHAMIVAKYRDDFFDLFRPSDMDALRIVKVDTEKRLALVEASDGFQQSVKLYMLKGVEPPR